MYLRYAGLFGALVLILILVRLFQWANTKWGISKRFHELMGQGLADRVIQFGFIALAALAAEGLKWAGLPIPASLEQFIPSTLTTIVAGLLATESYRVARRAPDNLDHNDPANP